MSQAAVGCYLGYYKKLISEDEIANVNFLPFPIIAFDRSNIARYGYPSCVQRHRRRRSPLNIIVSDISPKTRCFGCISVAESLGISSTTFTQCAPETTEFGEITQNTGHYVVQGQSRSPILVPIESSYTTAGIRRGKKEEEKR